METRVGEILEAKGDDVWSVSPDATVFEGLELMADKNIGAVLVVEDGHLKGIFSERDYARKVILVGKSSRETTVGDLMTQDVIAVHPDTSVKECFGLFTEHRIRHLPVVDDNEPVGMITIGDTVKRLILNLEGTVHDLENYITGGGYGATVS